MVGPDTVRWQLAALETRNRMKDRDRDRDRIIMTVIVGVGTMEEEVVSTTILIITVTAIRIVRVVIAVMAVIAAMSVMTAQPVSMSDVVPFARSRCTVSMDLEIVSVLQHPITLWAITTEIVAIAVMHAVGYWDVVTLGIVAPEWTVRAVTEREERVFVEVFWSGLQWSSCFVCR